MPGLKLDLQSLTRDLSTLLKPSPTLTTHMQRVVDSPDVTSALDVIEQASAVAAVADSYLAPSDVTSLDLSATKYKLRDYQVTGIEFLRTHKKRFLTDKPGLGKTIVSICAAELPVIVFAPTYLTYNWFNVLTEVAGSQNPPQTIALCSGPKAKRQAALAAGADWTICGVEMLRDYEFPREYRTVIIDEAHHLRGHSSQQSLGAIKLAAKAEYVFLLTATPIFNKPDDLYGQLRLLDRERFNSYWRFRDNYTVQVQMPFGPKVIGARASLRPLFESYNLGRTYADVSMSLPSLLVDKIVIDPPDDFKKLYKTLKEQYYIPGQEVYSNALQVLQHLRKLTGPQKLKPLLSLLTDTDALEGTVIFSWYKETAEAVADLLDIPCVTGDMPPAKRLAVAKSGTCISATISSMAEGVDLSHLHTVVFFELDYVPGILYQALSRVRRHGGADVVKVIYLLVKNTVDEVLYNVDEKRTLTINEIVRHCLE